MRKTKTKMLYVIFGATIGWCIYYYGSISDPKNILFPHKQIDNLEKRVDSLETKVDALIKVMEESK